RQLSATLFTAKRNHWRVCSGHLHCHRGIPSRLRGNDPTRLAIGGRELVSSDRQGLIPCKSERIAVSKRPGIRARKIQLRRFRHSRFLLGLGCCRWSFWSLLWRRILGSECPKPADRQE